MHVSIRGHATPAQAAAISAALDIELSTTLSPPHPHPYLAAARGKAERVMHKLARRMPTHAAARARCIDVGSNPARALSYHVFGTGELHVSTPQVLPNDRARAASAIARLHGVAGTGSSHHCYCLAEDEIHGPFGVAISTHVLYYLSAEEVARFLDKSVLSRTIFSVHHQFTGGINGTFGYSTDDGTTTEAHWTRSERLGGPRIVMSVLPDARGYPSYAHPFQPYLQEEYTATSLGVLHTHVEARIGPVVLARITLDPGRTPPPGDLQVLTLPVSPLADVPHTTWTGLSRSSTQLVVYDEALVDRVAAPLSYRDRDAATFQDATRLARRVVRDAHLPAGTEAAAVAQIAARAMTHNLDNERVHLASMQYVHGDAIAAHRSALTGNTRQLVEQADLWSIAMFVAAEVAIKLSSTSYNPSSSGLVLWFTSRYAQAVLSFYAARLAWRRLFGHGSDAGYLQRAWLRAARAGAPHTLLRGGSFAVALPATAVALKDFPPMDEHASLRIGPDDRPPKHPGAPRDVIFLQGATSTSAVSMHDSTPETEEAALRHRVLRAVPPCDVSYLQECLTTFALTRVNGCLLTEPIPEINPDTLRLSWLARLDPPIRVRMAAARRTLQSLPLGRDPDDYVRQCFIKREKSQAVSSLFGTPPSAPRPIQANNPNGRMSAACNPACWHAQRHIFSLPSLLDTVCFAPGRTCEQIGAAFAAHYVPGDYLLSADMTKFDTHLRADVYQAMFDILIRWGFDADVARHELAAGCSGRTVHGLVYTAPSQLCSGDGITSVMGSLVNLFLMVTFCSPRAIRHYSLISGDDSLTVLPADVDFPTAAYEAHCLRLGFVVKASLTRELGHAPFCSKLMWPVAEPCKYVLGPLIGRQLGKIAYTTDDTHTGNFRGGLLSLQRDAAHIPFLRVYVAHCLPLTKGAAKFGRHHAHMNQAAAPHALHPDAWSIVAARYEMGPLDEQAYADWLRTKVTSLPHVETMPLVERLIAVDAETEEADLC